MIIPDAPQAYASGAFNQIIRSIKNELGNRWRKGTDIELSRERLILRSPNGSRWIIRVSDAGVVSAEAAP